MEELILAQNEDDSGEKFLEMRREIDALKEGAGRAEKLLSEANSNVTSERLALTNKKAEFDKLHLDWKKYSDHLKVEKKELQEKLTQAQADSLALKKSEGSPAAKFNPDDAIALREQLDSASTRVTSLNNQLQSKNAEIKSYVDLKSSSLKTIKTLEANLAAAKLDRDEILARKDGIDLEAVCVDVNHDLVRAYWGDKGLNWLLKAHATTPGDIKNVVYNLMLMAKGKQKGPLKTLFNILQSAYDALARVSYKTRMQLASWVSEIKTDLSHMTLKPASYYRERLEEAVKRIVTASSSAAKAYEKKKAQILEEAFKSTGGNPGRFTFVRSVASIFWKDLKRFGSRLIPTKSISKGFSWSLSLVRRGTQKVYPLLVRAAIKVSDFVFEHWPMFAYSYYKGMFRYHEQGLHLNPVYGCPLCNLEHDYPAYERQQAYLTKKFPHRFGKGKGPASRNAPSEPVEEATAPRVFPLD